MDVAAPAKSPTVSPANLVEYSRTHTAALWSSSDIVRTFKDGWQALGFRVRGSSFSRALTVQRNHKLSLPKPPGAASAK
jgi:hypothetical protein